MKKEVKEKTGEPGWVEFCHRMNINPNLVMLKVTLFVMYGASASLVPFLTIHMQSIGLTVEEIAVVYLALPLTTFLAPPVTGFLVDKFGHYKPVLIISLVLNVVFHHALMLIPQMEMPGETPAAYVMRHPTSGKVEVWWSPCPSRECPDEEELNMVLDDCLDYCSVKQPESPPPTSWFKGIEKSIAYRPPTLIGHTDCTCPKSKYSDSGDALAERGTASNNEHRIQFLFGKPQGHKNATKAKIPIKKKNGKNGTSLIPPIGGVNGTNGSYGVNDTNGGNGSNINGTVLPQPIQNVTKPEEDHSTYFLLGMHPDLMTASEQLGMELPEPEDSSEVTDFRQHFSEELLTMAGVNYTHLEEADLRCGGRVIATNLTINRLKEMAADCMLQKCDFRAGGPDVCPPDYKESDDRVFWLYFALRFIGNTMHLASVTIMDPIALQMIQQHGGEFGRERLFSTVGMAIFSPLTGLLIDQRSRWLGYTDYSSAFWSYDALLCISVVTVMLMPLGVKVPADNIMQDMIRLIKFPHVITFIFFLFALGNCWGFIESFLFLYLKELGAPNYLLGITVSVGTISSIPFLYGAEKITKKFGHVNIIVIAFFSHAVRLMGYSFIENPWWVFPFEAIEALAVHLMWVAAATYCAILAPKNLLATLIGVLGMAHFSLGRGSGSFVGGLLIGKIGTRKSFRIMGLLSITLGVIYGVLHCLWLHKFDVKKDKKKEQKDAAEAEKLNGDVQTEEEEEKARVSLMIKFNHRGSLSSLDRDKMYSSLSRRSSANIELNSKTLPPIVKNASKPESINALIETYNLQRKSPLQISRKISKVHEENEVLAAETNSQQSLNLNHSSTTPLPQSPTDESRPRSDSIPEE